MNREHRAGRPLEERLNLLPSDRLPPTARHDLAQLAKELDHVGRRDPQSQEVYIDERSFRKVLENHLPPNFVSRLIPMIQDLPGGRDVIRTTDAHGKAGGQQTAVPWETVAALKGMRVTHEETFEGLGLHTASTMQDIKNIMQPHLAGVPDDLFRPELGDRVRQAIDRFASASETEGVMRAATDQAYWEAFKRCFAQYTSTWVAVAFMVFLTAFVIVLLATANPVAATIAGLAYAAISIPVWFLMGAVHCFVTAAFS